MHYGGIRVTVMGLGLFGGGVGAARHFAAHGAQVTVTDTRRQDVLQPSMEALADLPIRYVLGRHEAEDFVNADIVVVNPGVPNDSPFVVMARGAGAQIEREMNLLFRLTPAHPKFGVTGSNGKSTTAAMLHAMLSVAEPRAVLGGNIGRSLLGDLERIPCEAPLVLELSSFQLQGLRELEESPNVAIVTNLSPNHLDWHRSLQEYYEAKRVILDYQRPGDLAILNADDPNLLAWASHVKGRVAWVSLKGAVDGDAAWLEGQDLVVRWNGAEEVLLDLPHLPLPGRHNAVNALMAGAAALAHGVKPWQISEALMNFRGLPHRLEMVARDSEEIAFYNDSIATTPESVMCALNSFSGPLTLIAGGSDKGVSFAKLGEAVARRVRRLILIGKTAPQIESAVREAEALTGRRPEILRAGGLEEAAGLAYTAAKPGEVVLLSPACASFDMFRNFEERGDRFRALAQHLARRGRGAVCAAAGN